MVRHLYLFGTDAVLFFRYFLAHSYIIGTGVDPVELKNLLIPDHDFFSFQLPGSPELKLLVWLLVFYWLTDTTDLNFFSFILTLRFMIR